MGLPERWQPLRPTDEADQPSPLPEAFAAMMLSAMLVAFWPPVRSVEQLILVLLVVVAAGASGRFPLTGNILVVTGLLIGLLLGHEVTSDYFALLIGAEAIAARGRRRWTFTVLAVHAAVLGTLTIGWISRSPDLGLPVAAQAILFMLVQLIVAVGIGHLRYRLRRTQRDHQLRRQAELTALRLDIARTLHDSVAYDLTSIVLRAGELQAQSQDQQTKDQLGVIVATGQGAVNDMRTMLKTLRQQLPESSGSRPGRDLAAVLDSEQRRLISEGFSPTVSVDGDLTTLPTLISRTVGQCLFELVNNVLRHGTPAGVCQIALEIGEDRLELAVLNQVRPGRPRPHHRGLGLIGIAERVDTVDGVLTYGPRAEQLWIVEASIPLRHGWAGAS